MHIAPFNLYIFEVTRRCKGRTDLISHPRISHRRDRYYCILYTRGGDIISFGLYEFALSHSLSSSCLKYFNSKITLRVCSQDWQKRIVLMGVIQQRSSLFLPSLCDYCEFIKMKSQQHVRLPHSDGVCRVYFSSLKTQSMGEWVFSAPWPPSLLGITAANPTVDFTALLQHYLLSLLKDILM